MCSIILASFADSKACWRSALTLTICLVCRSIFLTCSPWGHLAEPCPDCAIQLFASRELSALPDSAHPQAVWISLLVSCLHECVFVICSNRHVCSCLLSVDHGQDTAPVRDSHCWLWGLLSHPAAPHHHLRLCVEVSNPQSKVQHNNLYT